MNQYASIAENDEEPFVPTYDGDGNQTKIKTSTGIWTVAYNALNRPVRFTRTAEDGTVTTITADYDFMGRRVYRKVETTSADPETGDPVTTVTSHQRSLYRGYLQIAALDLTRSTLNAFWYILWDPTETVATRPLAIQTAGSWFTYGLDLTKNVTELYKSDGTIANAYTYAPFGGVTQAGNITNPLQWSSEVYDAELGMVYYNFRFYNPRDGRWISRDPIGESGGLNVYSLSHNGAIHLWDRLGLRKCCCGDKEKPFDACCVDGVIQSSRQCTIDIFLGHGAKNPAEAKDMRKRIESCGSDRLSVVSCYSKEMNSSIPKPQQFPNPASQTGTLSQDPSATIPALMVSVEAARAEAMSMCADCASQCCSSVQIWVSADKEPGITLIRQAFGQSPYVLTIACLQDPCEGRGGRYVD